VEDRRLDGSKGQWTAMKVLTVSDVIVPELVRRIREGRMGKVDLLLSCGDLPPEYLSFLAHGLGAPLYYVRGNHDIRYDDRPPQGGTGIHCRLATERGLRLLGFDGSNWYNGGPNQYSETQMQWMVYRMRLALWCRPGPDIVITHAPPRYIHDAEDPCHRGFKSFLGLIRKRQPRYFIHGHVHRHFQDASERVTRMKATQVINTYGYYTFEIEAQRAV
jgi:Icc-related predicted phosphoesterase